MPVIAQQLQITSVSINKVSVPKPWAQRNFLLIRSTKRRCLSPVSPSRTRILSRRNPSAVRLNFRVEVKSGTCIQFLRLRIMIAPDILQANKEKRGRLCNVEARVAVT